jgi:hypothetical protein
MEFLWKHALTILGGLQVVVGVFSPLFATLPPAVVPWVLAGSGAITALIAYIKAQPKDPTL